MSLILFIYGVFAFCAAVGASVWWGGAPAPRSWPGGLLSLGLWGEFLVILYMALSHQPIPHG